MDSVEEYKPPKELTTLLEQLPEQIRDKYLNICKNRDYFKWGNPVLLKNKFIQAWEKIRNSNVVDSKTAKALFNYVVYFKGIEKPTTLLFLLYKDDTAFKFAIDYAAKNDGYFFGYNDNIKQEEFWELELKLYKLLGKPNRYPD